MTARTRLATLVLASAVFGFLVGTRAIGGSVEAEVASAPARDAGSVEPHRLRGSFWRPVGSDAERPAPSLERVTWKPSGPGPNAPVPQPDALASVQAILSLTSP